jgi:hypothetical protein
MSTGRLLVGMAALAASLLVPAVGRAAESPPHKAVRECIERNGARYATPDKAWISQYVSLEDACRARFGKEGDVTLTVTPLATGVTAKETAGVRTSVSADRGSSGTTTTTSNGHVVTKKQRGTGGTASPTGRVSSSAPAIRAALAQTQARASVVPDGLVPAWLWVIVLGLPFAAAAVRIARRR